MKSPRGDFSLEVVLEMRGVFCLVESVCRIHREGGVVCGNARDCVKQSSTHHKTKTIVRSTDAFGCEVERSQR